MKKFLTLAFVAVLMLGLAATTYAMEWGASGFVRVRSALHVNATDPNLGVFPFVDPVTLELLDPNDHFDDSQAWMDTRFRLKFTAKANDYASGVIYFEGDSTEWGETADEDPRNEAGQWGADRAGIELKQFYLDFKVPGVSDFAPTTLRAGIQGFAVRSHFLMYADGAGVEVNSTIGPVKTSWYWYKPNEGDTWRADDGTCTG